MEMELMHAELNKVCLGTTVSYESFVCKVRRKQGHQQNSKKNKLEEGHSLDSNEASIINFLVARTTRRKRLRNTAKECCRDFCFQKGSMHLLMCLPGPWTVTIYEAINTKPKTYQMCCLSCGQYNLIKFGLHWVKMECSALGVIQSI